MATAWSLDFCLVCDRQTLGDAYCSQACRLAEMDGCATAADSEPSSPTTTTTTTAASPWAAQRAEAQHQPSSALQLLGPAIDFSCYKFPGSSSARHLSPSSSQTSLSSLHSVSSNSSSSSLSGQARSELENYSGSFDKVRDWKRRRTAS